MKSLLLIMFSMFALILHAQDEPVEVDFGSELGVGLEFVNRFLPLDNNIGDISPYQFFYNSYQSEDVYNNYSLVANLDFATEKDTEEERKINITNVNFVFRAGKTKMRNVHDKFFITHGLDIQPSIGFNSTSTELLDSSEKSSVKSFLASLYAGPSLGARYFFTDKLSIGTELTYYFGVEFRKSSLDTSITSVDESETTFRARTIFRAPTYLILFYKF